MSDAVLLPGTPIEVPRFACSVCGHTWTAREPMVPIRCAGCKTPYWNRPAQDARKTPQPSPRKPKAGKQKG